MPDIATGIGAGVGLIGADKQADAATSAADSQAAAARTAAEAAAFRPVGVTTRFGRSGYTYDPSGKVIGAGYQVAPDLAAQREGLMGLAGGSLAQAQEWASTQPYFNNKALQMGQIAEKYIADPAKASADWMSQQQGLLAPGREQALAKVRNDLQQTGRAGLSFGATQSGNRAATNPEMAAYYNAMANQDQQLASQADAYGRERTNYGIGLLGAGVNTAQQGFELQNAALSPWKGYLGGAQQIESMGQGAMDMATALGAQQSTAGANQGQYLARAGSTGTGFSPLGTTLMGLAGNQQFTSGLGNWFSGSGSTNPYSIAPTPTNIPSMGGGQGLDPSAGTFFRSWV